MEKGEGCRKNYPLTITAVDDVTNTRFARSTGLPVVPFSLTTTPVPLRKPRARHDLTNAGPQEAASFRLRLGDGRCAPATIR